jgi:hypothetical protein
VNKEGHKENRKAKKKERQVIRGGRKTYKE